MHAVEVPVFESLAKGQPGQLGVADGLAIWSRMRTSLARGSGTLVKISSLGCR